ncbi:hypothetical protein CAPTEDRAFT_103113, partial [Capitella teleta]
GSPCEEESGVQRRMLVYNTSISLLQTSELNSKLASSIVQCLRMETDSLPSECLADLASGYVDSIKNDKLGSGRSLELFPRFLSVIQIVEKVNVLNMSGSEFKGHLINKICSNRWPTANVVHLASMFKDVTLSSDELKFVLSKLLRMLPETDSQTLPPLIYQILPLSSKGHKKYVLEGIMKYFAKEDATFKEHENKQRYPEYKSYFYPRMENLHLIEGTVLLHMKFAVKQDQELGKAFVKILKSEGLENASAFSLALALSIARMHFFEEQIFELLKSLIAKSLKDAAQKEESYFVQQMYPKTTDVSIVISDTVKYSAIGWDDVPQGLLQLGFTLMDAFGPKAAFGRPVEVVNTAFLTPSQKACNIGAKILMDTFKIHKMARKEILDQIWNRIIIKGTSTVSHLIDLLSHLSTTHPLIVLESQSKVREILDYLAFLPASTSEGLLKAIQPLLRVSPSLRDSIILVLRKSMFSNQLEARQVAVMGFLLFLKNFKILGGFSFSQASQSSLASSELVQVELHQPYSAGGNAALCLEIISNLRRSLSQQADVRLTLYEGLNEVLCKNQQLCRSVLSVLLFQWKKYYVSSEDVNPPVKLGPCVVNQGGSINIVEPLSHLLSSLCQCLITSSMNDETDEELETEDEDLFEEFDVILASLTRRLIKCDLEDFELDKSADYSCNSSVGVKNTVNALLVSGIYEVILEYTFTTGNYEISSCESVIQLFEKFQVVSGIVKDKSSGGVKRGRPGGSLSPGKATKSLLSLRFVNVMLRALFSDSTPKRQESLAVLRSSTDFQRYILTVAQQKITLIAQTGKCDGPEGRVKEKVFKYLSSTARLLLFIFEDLQTADEVRTEKSRANALIALETFSSIIEIITQQYSHQMDKFLANLDRKQDHGDGDRSVVMIELLQRQIKKYQWMVITVLSSDSERCQKEAIFLLNIIGNLTKLLPSKGDMFMQVQSWMLKVCSEQTLDDTVLAKTAFTLLLTVTSQMKNSASLARDIGRDIHCKLGDIDAEVEIEDEAIFSGINERTAAPSIHLLLLAHVDRQLDHAEWVIDRLKASSTLTDKEEDEPSLTQVESQEKSLALHLGHLINGFHEMVQTALPIGSSVENMIKALARLYNVLVAFTKYYLMLYQQKCGHLSTRFEKLVKLSSTNLTQYVYTFITYIQKSKSKKQKNKASSSSSAPGRCVALKESRCIPNLIFAMEQYERFLIQLSNKSKVSLHSCVNSEMIFDSFKVNLMDHFKVSTARDFRIMAANIHEEAGKSDNDEVFSTFCY